ncbi:MAG: sugar nucleotide-binding protein, partial [Candidatus Omnitrophica bacterium]|nr:sugar nucleotide-binding protein [Candidatus Omnitrophota bacterium]
RTSWLFGSGGKNFVDTIIAKAGGGSRLDVVDDQTGSPTYTVDLANAITGVLLRTPNPSTMLRIRPERSRGANSAPRTVNITNSGSCSWYDFAKEILRVRGMEKAPLERISSEELSRPAKRPRMSVLDNSRFKELKGSLLPPWQDALRRYLLE